MLLNYVCNDRYIFLFADGEESMDVSLEDFLIFCTGYDVVPPHGFPVQPKIAFDHDKSGYEEGWLWTSTCTLELTLPTSHATYGGFKETILNCVKHTKLFDAR